MSWKITRIRDKGEMITIKDKSREDSWCNKEMKVEFIGITTDDIGNKFVIYHSPYSKYVHHVYMPNITLVAPEGKSWDDLQPRNQYDLVRGRGTFCKHCDSEGYCAFKDDEGDNHYCGSGLCRNAKYEYQKPRRSRKTK